MKYVISVLTALLLIAGTSRAASIIKAGQPIVADHLQVEHFIRMTPTQFEQATGKKLSLLQKMYFKKLQRKISQGRYDHNTTILHHFDEAKGKFKLDPVWFVLGCLIGPFALLFSFTSDKPTSAKHISAAIGLPVFILWFGSLFLF